MVAAAAPPARPLPTTMTVYFRLVAGFTSFISNRCLSHFPSMGPSGIFAFSSIPFSRSRPNHAGVHGEGDHRKASPDEDRQRQRERPPERVGRWGADAQAPPPPPMAGH